MTMSPLYPSGKPCSRGTHDETVKNLALSPAFDRSNHDRITSVALFNGHYLERKCDIKHVNETKLMKLGINMKRKVHFTW